MATSRREPHSDARINRAARNTSPVLRASELGHGLRRARSVPSSPDRKLPPSPASSLPRSSRPSSSFNARTASSQSSTFGSASSSSIHGRTLHHPSSMAATTKHADAVRGKADKSGGASLWPPALAARSPSSKDTNRTAKSPSTLQKSKLSPRPGAEKMAASSPKLRTQKGISGGRTQAAAVSLACAPGATAKGKTRAANSVPCIQRATSVPARPIEAPKMEEQEVELLMEFDEMESISTPSIEEHLQEWLPDPVELKHVDAIACATSQDDPSKPSSNQQEEKNEQVTEPIPEEKLEAIDDEDLNGENADAGINGEVHVMKEAADDTEVNGAVVEPEFKVEEEAKEKAENVMPPKKTLQLVQGWKKDDARSNEVTEEGRSKPMEERKSKVMALIGKFETAMSG